MRFKLGLKRLMLEEADSGAEHAPARSVRAGRAVARRLARTYRLNKDRDDRFQPRAGSAEGRML
jgi:hypothetical protein